MGTSLHGAARTTPRVRAEFQASQESTRALAARYGVNAKTVAKWRKHTSTLDRPMGPSQPKSTVLTEIEEAIVVEFRRRTLLPLDDVLGCLRETIQAVPQRAPSLPAAARHLAIAEERGERRQTRSLCQDHDNGRSVAK